MRRLVLQGSLRVVNEHPLTVELTPKGRKHLIRKIEKYFDINALWHKP